MGRMQPQPLERCVEICNSLPTKYAAIVAIGVSTGCRISEILALRRGDLIENGRLRREVEFLKLKARCKAKRRMIIPEAYRPYIIQHLNEEAERGFTTREDFVFRGQFGNPLERMTVYNFFRKTFGPNFGTHWMRKTFAVAMYQFYSQKYNETFKAANMVKQLLGHARLDTTARYLCLDEAEQYADIETVFALENRRHRNDSEASEGSHMEEQKESDGLRAK